MSLEEYKSKRDFKRTPEPADNISKSNTPIFVIHEHHATHLHWDLRLEVEGVLKSWALPKPPPLEYGVKRLAVQTEDHPLSYADFSGVIPEGEYGAGTVDIWDKGKLTIKKITSDSIHFELEGQKMKGEYVLIRLKTSEQPNKNWLFFKKK
ncbi:MAG: 3'-phosphoesterase [Candidatus Odinarchaeum yellowstonii]|jgi:DNA ligase D-like protein (predicted 3'-phosphoesterase)|uniref:3'-phosphoesterase n=1 Tax=Odinarchaeota yellowstonii (strain LCB_4) TaxID=1841599 RepID=A0AAF0D3J9_ODILC|nr:MAG: 3'-phosphoesterase [Candidatus Odinarchaeum yellowstonii]